MNVNSDINVLGSLKDWETIQLLFKSNHNFLEGSFSSNVMMKTDKSISRFSKAINSTLLYVQNAKLTPVFEDYILKKFHSRECLFLLFWNTSINNDLFNYINLNVFFPAYYSGRAMLKSDEVASCIMDLRNSEVQLEKWTENTISTTASKYLTLMKKFGLMDGSMNKTLIHPHLDDSAFILFIYWLSAIADSSNLLNSSWLTYSFSEKQIFLDRILQKKYANFFNLVYTGDRLSIDPIIPYESLYEHLNKS